MHTHKYLKLSQMTRLPSPETATHLEKCWIHKSNHASFVHCLERRVPTSMVTSSTSVRGCPLKSSAASKGCCNKSLGSYSCSTARCFLWSWWQGRSLQGPASYGFKLGKLQEEGSTLQNSPGDILSLRNEIAFSVRLKQDKDCRQD